jgi:Ca-activated chloride channel family protein
MILSMKPILLISLDDGLSFGHSAWLWALFLLLPLLWLFIDAGRRRETLLSRILAPRLQQQLAGQVSGLMRNLRIALLLSAIAFSFLALAQPRLGSIEQQVKSKGRDVIIAIDTSRSMLSTDTAPTRLGRAKLISQDLLNLLKGDRVGLIAFAGTSFLQAPLTLDKGAVLTSITDLDSNTIPKGGTDIASAIRLSIAAFGKGETMSRALVLMTDGEELNGDSLEAAKEAQASGVRIYTIGFGSPEGSLIPIKTEEGRNDFVRDESGRPVNSKLDASRLTQIAKETGGFYLPYGQDDAAVIYEKGIVSMEEEETGVMSARKPIERYAWPLGAVLLVLTLWSVLGEGKIRWWGKRMVSSLFWAMLLFPLDGSQGSLKAATSGIKEYQSGDYEAALKDFEHRIESGANASEIRFDAGAAAYKAGDYKKAADYFAGAMTSRNSKIRDAATYNLANSLVRSGESAQEKEAKLSDWKNALQHYETVLKDHPEDKPTKENREIVRKLIEKLQKQQEQDKKQDKKNDKDQKDKNKDQDKSKSDQSQGGGGGQKDSKDKGKDQQKNDQSQGENGKDQDKDKDKGENKPQDSKQGQSDQKKDQGNQGQQQASPTPTPDQGGGGSQEKSESPQQGSQSQSEKQQQADQQAGHGVQPTPTPSDKKQGKLTGGQQGEKKEGQQAEVAESDDGKDGKMSPNQARSLLRSVQDEEAHQLNNQQNRAVEQPLRDW